TDQADRLWETLSRSSEVGSKRLAATLYGDAPRCMAYLDANVRRSAPSLLSQQLATLSPERIAEALIGLTGRGHPPDPEVEQRRILAAQKELLATRSEEDGQQRIVEQNELDSVFYRNQTRAHLAEGESMWRLHFAKGYLDVLERDAIAAERISAAQEKLAEAQALKNTVVEEL